MICGGSWWSLVLWKTTSMRWWDDEKKKERKDEEEETLLLHALFVSLRFGCFWEKIKRCDEPVVLYEDEREAQGSLLWPRLTWTVPEQSSYNLQLCGPYHLLPSSIVYWVAYYKIYARATLVRYDFVFVGITAAQTSCLPKPNWAALLLFQSRRVGSNGVSQLLHPIPSHRTTSSTSLL